MSKGIEFLGGVALGLAGRNARKRKKVKPNKGPSAAGWLALGMFTWGLVKAAALARHMAPDCPICAEDQMRRVAHPSHLVRSVLTAPITEELMFRHNLQPLIGQQASAVLFGVAHASPRLGAVENALRVLEAGLAGGLVYGEAYNQAGVIGSTLVHAAHNAGADLGLYLSLKSGFEQNRRLQARYGIGPYAAPPAPPAIAVIPARPRPSFSFLPPRT